MNITDRPWMPALETQLQALTVIRRLQHAKLPTALEMEHRWDVDYMLLRQSSPFAWASNVIDIVSEAGKSIPLDTRMNKWNLNSPAAWWYFEKPLPFITVSKNDPGVRALNFGWLPTTVGTYGMPYCVWLDDYERLGPSISTVVPSQTWEWAKDQSLGEMLVATRKHHERLYGPGGRWHHKPHVGTDAFMAAAEGLARFTLAGLAWLDQKILVKDAGAIERHRRKAFTKETNRRVDAVQVIQLRKAERVEREHTDSEHKHVDWSCRWVVKGHWKNQPCGAHSSDRKLIYVFPFPKGPDDKPFKAASTTVYEVNR
jgi:hypothetical protein